MFYRSLWQVFCLDTSGIDTKKPHNKTCYKVFKGGSWDWLLRRQCLLRLTPFPLACRRGSSDLHALRKELKNQSHLSLATMYANKFAPYYLKTKRCRFATSPCFVCFVRVEDGIRTHDLRNHNPSL